MLSASSPSTDLGALPPPSLTSPAVVNDADAGGTAGSPADFALLLGACTEPVAPTRPQALPVPPTAIPPRRVSMAQCVVEPAPLVEAEATLAASAVEAAGLEVSPTTDPVPEDPAPEATLEADDETAESVPTWVWLPKLSPVPAEPAPRAMHLATGHRAEGVAGPLGEESAAMVPSEPRSSHAPRTWPDRAEPRSAPLMTDDATPGAKAAIRFELPSTAAEGATVARSGFDRPAASSPSSGYKADPLPPGLKSASPPPAPFAGPVGTPPLATSAAAAPVEERAMEVIVDKLVKPALRSLGIDPAKVTATMEIVAAHRSASPAEGAGEPAPGFATGASRTVEQVLRTAEQMQSAERSGLQLRLDFGNSGPLSVQITLRQGRVHTLFRSDSTEVRDTIASAWTSFSQRSEAGGLSLAEPLFLPLRPAPATAAAADVQRNSGSLTQGDADGRSGRESRASSEESRLPASRSSRRRGGIVAPSVSRPELAPGHLRVHA